MTKANAKIVVGVAGWGLAFFSFGATKPIAQWSFEDSSNLGAASIGSTAMTVAATSGATASQVSDGKINSAARLRKGTTIANALVVSSGVVPSGNAPFSVSVWLRPNSDSAASAYLLVNRTSTGGYPGSWTGSSWNGWNVRFSGGKLAIDFQDKWRNPSDDAGCVMATYPSGDNSDGAWHYLAVTRDASKKVSLYWDGNLLASKTLSNNQNVASTARLSIGGQDASNSFSGDYDELRVYDVAIPADEIKREYAFAKAVGRVATAEEGVEIADNERDYGDVSGAGTVRFSSTSYVELLSPGLLDFDGVYQVYAANVDFGMKGLPSAITSSSRLDVAGGGTVNFFGDVTLASLEGTNLLGAVNMAESKTLTVNQAGDTVYEGRFGASGSLAKTGSGTLTLKGDAALADVTVSGGTLALDCAIPYHRTGLVSYWRFEDPQNLGRDLCDRGDLTLAKTAGADLAQVADGKIGAAASLRKGTTVACAYLSPTHVLPTGTKAFTVSAWIRPASNSPSSAYLLVHRKLDAGVPGNWTAADWSGWFLRFVNSTKLAFDFTTSWRNPADDSQCVMASNVPSGIYKDGQWHHIAVTRDGEGNAAIYLDGTQLATKKLTVNQTVSSAGRLSFGGQDSSNSFSGDYDEVMVFERALTAEEVAAEYAATRPAEEDEILPVPDGHWTFDEIVEEGGKKLFKDLGVNGAHLLNTTNSSGAYVACVTGADINGGAAYVKDAGSYLQLADSTTASGLIQSSWPMFTLSLRFKNVSCTSLTRNPFFCFGNAKTAEGCLRLSYEGVAGTDGNLMAPQMLRVLPGCANSNGGYLIDDTNSSAGENTPWTTITLVNDQNTKKMKIYRDGICVREVSTAGSYYGNITAFLFDLSRIDIGYNTYTTYSGFMVDDFRVYKKVVLNDRQVRALVLDQAGISRASAKPLAAADVTVASGATLEVRDGRQVVKAVSGEGDVSIGAYGTLAVGDWSGFSGTISGAGAVEVSGWGPTAKVPRAVIAQSGSIDFPTLPEIGRYVIVAADAFDSPSDFSGWKVLVHGEEISSDKYALKIVGGEFLCKIKGGALLIVR